MGQTLLSQIDDAVIPALWHRAFHLIQLSPHYFSPFPPFLLIFLFVRSFTKCVDLFESSATSTARHSVTVQCVVLLESGISGQGTQNTGEDGLMFSALYLAALFPSCVIIELSWSFLCAPLPFLFLSLFLYWPPKKKENSLKCSCLPSLKAAAVRCSLASLVVTLSNKRHL